MTNGERLPETNNADDSSESHPKQTTTLPQATELIEQTPTHLILQALSSKDFAAARGRIFAGFRSKPETLKTPLARGRLISEVVRSEELADKLREVAKLADQAHKPLTHSQSPRTQHRNQAVSHSQSDEKLIELNREVRQLRAELKKATDETSALSRQLDASRVSHEGISVELGHLRKQLQWNERIRHRLENEIKSQRAVAEPTTRRAKGDARTPAKSATKTAQQGSAALSGAIERLISRNKLDTVTLVVDEALKIDPIDPLSLQTRALLRAARGDKAGATADLQLVFTAQLAAGSTADASTTLLKAVTLASGESRTMADKLFAALSKRSSEIASASAVFDVVAGSRGYEQLRNWCREPLKSLLFRENVGESGSSVGRTLMPSALFDEGALNGVTPQKVVQAVDFGDTKLVASIRAAIPKLDGLVRNEVEQAIRGASDESYVRVLTLRSLAGQAVIDASNVAFYEQEYLSNTKPAIANILAIRKALRWAGYFPIVTIADANLPFVIDFPSQLRAMVTRGEIELVDSGTDADEVIVREALRRNAVVVTNDYMADWDKDDIIHKVQFSVSLTDGGATLYF